MRRPRACRRFALPLPFCYLCGQEGDAERAHGLRAGRPAHTPRRLHTLAAAAVSADDRALDASALPTPFGVWIYTPDASVMHFLPASAIA